MNRIFCDGPCGRELNSAEPYSPRRVSVCLNIERVDGMHGAGIPSGRSHLCNDCAKRAFTNLGKA